MLVSYRGSRRRALCIFCMACASIMDGSHRPNVSIYGRFTHSKRPGNLANCRLRIGEHPACYILLLLIHRRLASSLPAPGASSLKARHCPLPDDVALKLGHGTEDVSYVEYVGTGR